MKSFKQFFFTEIADTATLAKIDRRVDNLCNIMLGEKVPFSFVDRKTKKIIVPENVKLTRQVLYDLVTRWVSGNKWDIKSNSLPPPTMHSVGKKILAAIEPDFIWEESEDLEPHQTNFPHGYGYPNIKKNWDGVIDLKIIRGVDENSDAWVKYNKENLHLFCNYVRKHIPWAVLKNDESDFKAYESVGGNYVLDDLSKLVDKGIYFFTYWYHAKPEDATEPWQKEAYNNAKNLAKQHPDIQDQINKYYQFVDYLQSYTPDNPYNQENYPLFVTLYDKTRRSVSADENGPWYSSLELKKSAQVNSYKQAENTAKAFYNQLDSDNLNGQPIIVLEKREGSIVASGKPQYE